MPEGEDGSKGASAADRPPAGGARGGRARPWSGPVRGTGRSLLVEFLEKRVAVVTNDGRIVVGELLGFDQVSNLVLRKCVERVFGAASGVESVEHGVYVLRGDNVAAVGEIDEARDSAVKWGEVVVCVCAFPLLRPVVLVVDGRYAER
jgi:U6 snRNA-associated Sm-like protein LSm8